MLEEQSATRDVSAEVLKFEVRTLCRTAALEGSLGVYPGRVSFSIFVGAYV